jgi:hypothetical protein
MKVKTGKGIRGNTLIVVAVFTGILSLLLLSYLSLVDGANALTVRSLTWNSALPIAEAGIEEAATAIESVPAQNTAGGLQTNGWVLLGNTLTKSGWLNDAYYSVGIAGANTAALVGPKNPPIICSTGYVQVPVRGGYIGRIVRVTTRFNSPWPYALLAKNSIAMNGNPVVDSYDSENPALSTGGAYDPKKHGDQAHVACNSWIQGCISMGNAQIYGYVGTSLGGSTTVGSVGAVGTTLYVDNKANRGTIQSGHSENNLDESFPDVTVPFTSGDSLYSAMVDGVNYAYVADSGNYYYPGSLSVGGGQALLVRGNATIYVTGSVTVGGTGYITIAPGASLTLVVGGPECAIGGGGLVNSGQNAANCSIQGLPTCTLGSYGGSGTYVGTIYAPSAAWTLTGGGGVAGALTASSFTLKGSVGVHYDQALGRSSGPPYRIVSWAEL